MAAKVQKTFPKSGAIRSDDAIRRRAAKRGVTFEEQLKTDLDRAEKARRKRKVDAKDDAGDEEIASANENGKTTVKDDEEIVAVKIHKTPTSGADDAVKIQKAPKMRSDDAIKRRAAKRGVTFEEQLKSDVKDDEDTSKQTAQKRKAVESTSNDVSADSVSAAPDKKRKKVTFAFTSFHDGKVDGYSSKLDAFIATNQLDAKCVAALGKLTEEQLKVVLKRANKTEVDLTKGSRSLLITAMCKQVRAASKLEALPWAEQAGPERIEYNRLLRERYEKHPDALTDEEMERAKVLIARDERKKAKKQTVAGRISVAPVPASGVDLETQIMQLKSGADAGKLREDAGKGMGKAKDKGKGKGKDKGKGKGKASGKDKGKDKGGGRGKGHGKFTGRGTAQ